MEVESFEERSDGVGEIGPASQAGPGSSGPLGWLQNTNHSPAVIGFIRRARRALPGDPEFGDPLSVAGVGGPSAAARAADRLLSRGGASHEVSLAGLQVWQALTERVSGRPANPEVTIVFTDLVGFSKWSLSVGDETTLRLLRRVAQVFEPPLLESGGHIVKRMGDGSMAVFSNPVTALRSVIRALDALKEVEIDGYHPKMRAGIHTGRPQRIGSDLLGVDVNIAARVMERATKGGLIISQSTLDRIDQQYLDALGVTPKKVRKQLFGPKASGVPEDLAMYWIRPRKDAGTEPDDGELAEA
ncbi:guanylate cyclase [Mycolicibacterium mucogenicum]|uniref:Guanylate cyclase n=1 Tax=Mycolicibacterium mucogenicum TaxID=56689 RepID=A0A1A3H7I3_MYCMU|nr:adenylate/guanylate cyclase domain-containing protein [Mycolicibacterium mucogenicum]OBJ43624.1 guanylate cyclase [Mycolicibacterium mucogenicum]